MFDELDTSIIGLTGLKGAGKDTVADQLVAKYGFEKRSFAKLLKDSVCALLDLTPDQIERWKNDPEIVVTVLGPNARLAEGYRSFTFRQFLQRYGTEAHRDVFGTHFWVDNAFVGMEPGKNYVFTDVRFVNEADAIRACFPNSTIVRVERPGLSSDDHASEVPLPIDRIDYTIFNDQDLYYLSQVVDSLMERIHNG